MSALYLGFNLMDANTAVLRRLFGTLMMPAFLALLGGATIALAQHTTPTAVISSPTSRSSGDAWRTDGVVGTLLHELPTSPLGASRAAAAATDMPSQALSKATTDGRTATSACANLLVRYIDIDMSMYNASLVSQPIDSNSLGGGTAEHTLAPPDAELKRLQFISDNVSEAAVTTGHTNIGMPLKFRTNTTTISGNAVKRSVTCENGIAKTTDSIQFDSDHGAASQCAPLC